MKYVTRSQSIDLKLRKTDVTCHGNSVEPMRLERHLYYMILLLFMLFTKHKLTGQNFNYSVTSDSVAWNELNAQTIIHAGNEPIVSNMKIGLGFTCTIAGQSFDSVNFENNGCLSFDNDRRVVFTSFNSFGVSTDTLYPTVISYTVLQEAPNRVLTIQYLNMELSGYVGVRQSYQINIHENGIVDIIHGSGNVDSSLINAASISVGLFNAQMDTDTCGVFYNGSINSPQAEFILPSFTAFPIYGTNAPIGTRILFTPNQ